MNKPFLFYSALATILLGASAILAIPELTLAQQDSSGWSRPVNLSNTDTQSDNPSMAVDPSGRVHVVWSEATNDGRSFISYTKLGEGVWSPANEIITSPNDPTASFPSLAADSLGVLHLVWSGDGTLYYSRAYAPYASRAQDWSRPTALEYAQSYLGRPHLQVDTQDALYLAYPITFGANSGIYITKSSDGGQNWSDPTIVYKNDHSDRTVDIPRLAVSSDGTLHVVWVESNYPESFPSLGIRYAHSNDFGTTWSGPLVLADGPYSFPAILTRAPNEVHVVYSGTTSDRYKFHIWSADGGRTWAEAFRNTELGGYQGLPALVEDSSGILHWLTSASVFRIHNDSLYHITRQDETWLPGEILLRNEPVEQNLKDVSAAVALGNDLHVVVQYPVASQIQSEGWQDEIYYMHTTLNTPGEPATALANPTPIPTVASIGTTSATSPEIRPTLTARENLSSPISASMVGIITIGSLASLALVVVVILLARRSQGQE